MYKEDVERKTGKPLGSSTLGQGPLPMHLDKSVDCDADTRESSKFGSND